MYKWVTCSVVMDENEHGSNIFCIARSDELVFIDIGMLNGHTSRFRETMEKHYGLETSTLYITHAHTLAMNTFRDCEIVAAEVARPRFEAHIATDFNEERLIRMERLFPHIRGVREGEFLWPTIGVKSKHRHNSVVFNIHDGHSACSSSIYIPEEN